jgi:hypothetical protein
VGKEIFLRHGGSVREDPPHHGVPDIEGECAAFEAGGPSLEHGPAAKEDLQAVRLRGRPTDDGGGVRFAEREQPGSGEVAGASDSPEPLCPLPKGEGAEEKLAGRPRQGEGLESVGHPVVEQIE